MAFQRLIHANWISANLVWSFRPPLFDAEPRRYQLLELFHGIVKRMLIEGGGIRDLPACLSQQVVQAIDDGRRSEVGRQVQFEQTSDSALKTFPVAQPRLQDLGWRVEPNQKV
jgi:hypothetical protein